MGELHPDLLFVVPSLKESKQVPSAARAVLIGRVRVATNLLWLKLCLRLQSPKFTLPIGQQTNNRVLFGKGINGVPLPSKSMRSAEFPGEACDAMQLFP
jgi:hypothetical protein